MSYTNLVEMFLDATEKYANEPIFGTKKRNQYHWTTYKQFARKVEELRGGLSQAGVSKGDMVGIISRNSEEWAIAAYATYTMGAIFVPMYEDQKPEEWSYIINDSGSKVVFAYNKTILKQLESVKDTINNVEKFIPIVSNDKENSFKALLKAGRNHKTDPIIPQGDDLMGLIYTSGTTGNPKGVMLTHKGVMLNCKGIDQLFDMGPGDVTLSFLPWAHIFGQVGELHCLIQCGYATAFAESVGKIVDNLGEVKPTVLMSVPRIFNKIYDSVHNKMADAPKPISELFKNGMKLATKKKKNQSLTLKEEALLFLAKKVVFKKIKAKFGGKLRYAMSGGAAIDPEVAQFIDNLDIQVFQGYGLSETSPMVSLNHPDHNIIGSVGKAFPGMKITIEPTEGTSKKGEGEIVVEGDGIMQGYLNLAKETKSVLKQGKFHTGDIGRLDSKGYLYITGRIKEQYKLENGKYVVPSPLEEKLKLSPLVTNSLLYGDNRKFNVGIIGVDSTALEKLAQDHKIKGKPNDLIKNSKIRKLVEEDLSHWQSNFKDYEKPRKFFLTTDDWNIENGLLTPSMKVKRKQVLERYQADIESLYTN